jgi:predicted O-linked N-acetylglucosamine transferase (SPINDLY family)
MSKHKKTPPSRPSAPSGRSAALLASAQAAQQAGRLQEAAEGYRAVLELEPAHADAQFSLAMLYHGAGLAAEAETGYRRTLALQPGRAAAYNNLGVLLAAQGRTEEAEAAYRQALSLVPEHIDALNNLGNLLSGLGRYQEAEAALQRLIALRPEAVNAHFNLGNLYLAQNRLDEAERAYRRTLELQPGTVAAINNLGQVLLRQNRPEEAEAAYRQAIALQPGYALSFNNLGNLLMEQQRAPEAEAAYRQAIGCDPRSVNAHYNLGNLLLGQERLTEAEASLRQALALDPTHGKALGLWAMLVRRLCLWQEAELADRLCGELIAAGYATDLPPFTLLTSPSLPAQAQKQGGHLYAEQQYAAALASPPLVGPGHHPAHSRLRIGYLSADFHQHATMDLLAGVLEQHDRERFDIRLYSYGPSAQDAARKRLLDSGLPFVELATLDDETAARHIAADEIDLLIDLKGHTESSRTGICARRPAPVIVNWLGYPATLGHARLADYLIGDPVVSPLEHAEQFSETLALLPHCYQPNDRRRIGVRLSRQAAGLPEQGFVFCSFNYSYKFSAEVFAAWCALLQDVPGSVLWLLAPHESAIANLRHAATACGIDPQRLIFAPILPVQDHLARLQLADLALDTFPVTSHTTASDALWAGIPLVTRIGENFVSRVAASLLQTIGLPELVTGSLEEYFALARDLALDPARLTTLREHLAQQRLSSPLFDTERFTRHLETLYLRIWEQHEKGLRAPIDLS